MADPADEMKQALRVGLSGVAGPHGAAARSREQGEDARLDGEDARTYVAQVLAMDDKALRTLTPHLAAGTTPDDRRYALVNAYPGGLNAYADALQAQARQAAERPVTGSRVAKPGETTIKK